ncbi:interferon-induced transmembrane protein 3 [Callorhinchus milii]|uniref:Interferon induced transmembrane protein 3 n=1 Tax=Callorhinchus milii TaxID=7868 RepID=V9KTK9_CALMI|nr:interferon-induced transmembrane protein 3 [Callorhinchus milii]|eukprot:gi/632973093/ref/XP_007902982.1/ PREDICTED: interferon-induced transmembrane protein 3-like [Callorhinchus milii]
MEGKQQTLYPNPGQQQVPPPQYCEGKGVAPYTHPHPYPYPYPYPGGDQQQLYGPQYPLLDGARYPGASQPMQPPLYPHADGRQAVCSPGAAQPAAVPRVPAGVGDPPPLRDHVLWSVFNTVYLDCCLLGFIALVYSVKARDRIVIRDTEGARSYSTIAKRLNIAATVLTLVFYVIIIIWTIRNRY